jgi:hypothetical protein
LQLQLGRRPPGTTGQDKTTNRVGMASPHLKNLIAVPRPAHRVLFTVWLPLLLRAIGHPMHSHTPSSHHAAASFVFLPCRCTHPFRSTCPPPFQRIRTSSVSVLQLRIQRNVLETYRSDEWNCPCGFWCCLELPVLYGVLRTLAKHTDKTSVRALAPTHHPSVQ